MERTTLPLPGARRAEATLDEPAGGADAVVVACPPHPQHRGHRGDERLTAVSDALGERGVACLRFDYGEWDEGYGEREDARNAVRWAAARFDRVGAFGFSFGSAVAALAAADDDRVRAVSLLAPTPRLAPDLDALAALGDLADRGTPVQVVYAERDTTVDWEPVVERARELGFDVTGFGADHFFVGQAPKVAERVASFLGASLG